MDEDGLAEFLAPGTTIVQFNGTATRGSKGQARRSLFVKTAEKVTWTYKQGEDFLATCKAAERQSNNSQSATVFKKAAQSRRFVSGTNTQLSGTNTQLSGANTQLSGSGANTELSGANTDARDPTRAAAAGAKRGAARLSDQNTMETDDVSQQQQQQD